MKIRQVHEASKMIANGNQSSEFKDRLGRIIGAKYEIWQQLYVEADDSLEYGYLDTSQTYAREWAAGPGTYYEVRTQNLRAGESYQASTSKVFRDLADAQAYASAFMAKKAKDASKKAGK